MASDIANALFGQGDNLNGMTYTIGSADVEDVEAV